MRHPYVGLPDRQFWKKEKGIKNADLLDPVSDVPFIIKPQDRIVTAGSCFAQHVARFMTESGFNHHITERAHSIVPEKVAARNNYGMFSARYGNIYTAKQLRQLLDRSFGRFSPQQSAWKAQNGSGGVVDPFRPQIQPGGFLSNAELEADRTQHFGCVRQAIEEMDVFVFTLGLTEGWEDIDDGAVFPIAPGVAGGEYDAEGVRFVNFDEVESYDDLQAALTFIREINPRVRIILTVSPVPLNATYVDRHVLLSTAWSKAVLRIVAEKAAREFSDCAYFPSYEIITSPHVGGRYYAQDRREVTEEGVKHVMQLFIHHFTGGTSEARSTQVSEQTDKPMSRNHLERMQEVVDTLCDEAAIDNE